MKWERCIKRDRGCIYEIIHHFYSVPDCLARNVRASHLPKHHIVVPFHLCHRMGYFLALCFLFNLCHCASSDLFFETNILCSLETNEKCRNTFARTFFLSGSFHLDAPQAGQLSFFIVLSK